jgi:hypothetical protein
MSRDFLARLMALRIGAKPSSGWVITCMLISSASGMPGQP